MLIFDENGSNFPASFSYAIFMEIRATIAGEEQLQKSRRWTLAGHILAWVIFVALFFVNIIFHPLGISWKSIVPAAAFCLRACILFYLVYLVVIPRFLADGGLFRYLGILLATVTFITAATSGIDWLFLHFFGFPTTLINYAHSLSGGFLASFIFNLIVAFLATAGRFTFDWFLISRYYLIAPQKVNSSYVQINHGMEMLPDHTPVTDKPSVDHYIWLRSGGKEYKVDLAEIWYVEGMKDYVAYTGEFGRILVYQRMKAVEVLLSTSDFLRVHRSFIVARNKIEIIGPDSIYVAGRRIPVGPTYRSAVSDLDIGKRD